MPLYDTTCKDCGEIKELNIPLKDLEKPPPTCIICGGETVREFPVSAAMGFQPFEAYYDESLDMDINGRREKKQVLKALNLQETGDPVGGARNWDKNAPSSVKPTKPRGRSFDQQQKEGREAASFKESDVTVQNAGGDWVPAKMRDA